MRPQTDNVHFITCAKRSVKGLRRVSVLWMTCVAGSECAFSVDSLARRVTSLYSSAQLEDAGQRLRPPPSAPLLFPREGARLPVKGPAYPHSYWLLSLSFPQKRPLIGLPTHGNHDIFFFFYFTSVRIRISFVFSAIFPEGSFRVFLIGRAACPSKAQRFETVSMATAISLSSCL